MSKNRVSVDEVIKSAGSFTSAISLFGVQSLSSALLSSGKAITHLDQSAVDLVRGVLFLDSFTPRRALRQMMTALWRSAELTKLVTPGRENLLLREFQNKLEAFCLFEHIDYALNLSHNTPLSISQLVARTAKLGPYCSVWATEGVGHYVVDGDLGEGKYPHALMSRPESLEVPRASLVPLNAGMGLALAESLLDTADREKGIDRRVLSKFVQLCLSNCSPGNEGVGFEALGLAARSLHPQVIPAMEAILSCYFPELLEYFWHGVGRAIYFSPSQFLPFCAEPWHGLDMCLHEPPHTLGKQNAVAGFVWALTLVNIRQPEIVAAFLNRHMEQIPEREAVVNGLCSALLVWRETQPAERQLSEFVEYEPDSSESPLSRLWKKHVREPWDDVVQEHPINENNVGKLFRYQSLVDLAKARSS
jgi:hypothetical protein